MRNFDSENMFFLKKAPNVSMFGTRWVTKTSLRFVQKPEFWTGNSSFGQIFDCWENYRNFRLSPGSIRKHEALFKEIQCCEVVVGGTRDAKLPIVPWQFPIFHVSPWIRKSSHSFFCAKMWHRIFLACISKV